MPIVDTENSSGTLLSVNTVHIDMRLAEWSFAFRIWLRRLRDEGNSNTPVSRGSQVLGRSLVGAGAMLLLTKDSEQC